MGDEARIRGLALHTVKGALFLWKLGTLRAGLRVSPTEWILEGSGCKINRRLERGTSKTPRTRVQGEFSIELRQDTHGQSLVGSIAPIVSRR